MQRLCNVGDQNAIRHHAAMLVLAASVSLPSVAYAQAAQEHPTAPATATQAGSTAPDADPSADIVVTALKRSTTVQSTPISITAVSGQTLANSGVRDVTGLVRSAPGLSFVDAGPSDTRVIVRGIQSAGEPTVGIYLDETPIPGAVGSGGDAGGSTPLPKLFDVERVEVLKGPQGTLYGSGSMGGTVRVIFEKPVSTRWEGAVDLDTSTIHGGDPGFNVQAMVNVPVVKDVFALRAVGFVSDIGGYIDNVVSGRVNVNHNRTVGGRLLARLKPLPDLTIDASYMYQSTNAEIPLWTEEAGRYRSLAQIQYLDHDRQGVANLTAEWDAGPFTVTAVAADVNRQVNRAETDTSYFFGTYKNPDDCAFFAGTDGTACTPSQQSAYYSYVDRHIPSAIYSRQSVDTKSAEIRLASTSNRLLDWTIGGFYSDRVDHDNNSLYGASPQTGAIDLANVEYTRLIYDNLRQVAGFGEASLHLFSGLTATAGARYFDYRRKVGGATPIGLDLVGASFAGYSQVSSSESGWVSKYNVSYKLDRNILFYASASQGFRPGGVNQVLGLPSTLTPYRSDRLWDYEAGVKTSWFGNRLTANIAGYQIDWNDMQVMGNTPDGAFSFIANAGAARVRGIEAELSARPIHGLEIQANLSVSSAKLTKDQISANVLGPGRNGDRIPYVPRVTAGASAQYVRPLTNLLNGFARLDGGYVGSSYSEFNADNPFRRRIPSYALLNARLGVEGRQDNWGIYFYVNNLLNKLAINYATASGLTTGQTLVTSAAPRTIGINLRKSF